jgi:Fur family ferric uptake transcriptional regulator
MISWKNYNKILTYDIIDASSFCYMQIVPLSVHFLSKRMLIVAIKRGGNILSEKGFKNTKSRKAVISALENMQTAASADDILKCIKETGFSINLSTVYRTLDLMESKGLVEKTLMGDNRARYELKYGEHTHHIICTGCKKIVPIDVCPIEALEKDIVNKTSFDITGHKLELYGICPKCKKD